MPILLKLGRQVSIAFGVRRFIDAFAVRDFPRFANVCRELIPGAKSDIKMSHSKGKRFELVLMD
jgi:hypothetical protein